MSQFSARFGKLLLIITIVVLAAFFAPQKSAPFEFKPPLPTFHQGRFFPSAFAKPSLRCWEVCTKRVPPGCKLDGNPWEKCACVKHETVCDTPPDPTISGTLNCTVWGNGNWCIGEESILLSATEPDGENVLISGDVNGEVFACGPTAGSASCTIPLPEGTGTINYIATSAQGTTAGGAKNWQRDVTMPVIDGALTATEGTNNWFISPAEVSASVTETGSGLGTFETSLDNTNWAAYTTPLTFNDGVYALNLRATDIAGNIATVDLAFNIDTLPPIVDGTLDGRLGDANWYTSAVQASATPADATSGVAFTEYSTDGGSSWQSYAAPVNFDDGSHSIQFKTTDVAGLSALSPVYTFKADASAPHIRLPSRWYIWESITFELEEETSGFTDIEMQIMDSQGRWKKVEQHWQSDQNSFAHTLLWDRQFADGILAPIGNYPVLVRAWDEAGNMSEKTGQIIIPQPDAAPLPTLTNTPTVSAEPAEAPLPKVGSRETEIPIDTEKITAPAIPEPAPAKENQPKESVITFGSKSSAPTTPDSPITNPQSPILWGTTAAAAIGAFNAAMAERKRRERAEHLRQLKNWEGNKSNYMRKRGAQKAAIAEWREKQKKLQEQKEKRLAMREKILGFKEKILSPIIPPPKKEPSYVPPDMSWKRGDIRAAEDYQKNKELQEGLRAYYEGRKAGEMLDVSLTDWKKADMRATSAPSSGWALGNSSYSWSQAYRSQGTATNDCGPTNLAVVLNGLIGGNWEKDNVFPERLGGPYYPENIHGATLPSAMADEFNRIAQIGKISRTAVHYSHATKDELVHEIQNGNPVTILRIWPRPGFLQPSGAHYQTIIGYDDVTDTVYYIDPNAKYANVRPEAKIQSESWDEFAQDWGRRQLWSMFKGIHNEMIVYQP